MSEKELIKSAKKYSLMVDWKSRLSREIPFLKEQLKNLGITSGKIVDVGCGPGHHASELARSGYIMTALDIKTEALENESSEVIEGDFIDKNILKSRRFDALYSLGNTAALIASQYTYGEVIKRFSEVIRPGGALIFQTLNFAKERNSWSPPRGACTEDGEYVFLRNFTTTEKHVRPLIISLYRPKGTSKWQLETSGPTDIPRIDSGKMRRLLEENGFENISLYGSYSKEPFIPEKSVDMIWSALRMCK